MAGIALGQARADEAETILSADLVGRYGPAGIALLAGAARRWNEPETGSLLLAGRYVEAGVAVGVSPAYAQGGLRVEWVPLAPLQIRVQYDGLWFFGANRALIRVPSSSAPFGDRDLDRIAAGTGVGQRLLLSPTLRARRGRLVLRSQLDLAGYAIAPGPGVYYEPEYDTLVERRDAVVMSRTSLFVDFAHDAGQATLLVGPTYEVTRAVRTDVTRHRAGVVAFWGLGHRLWGLDRPRVFAHAGVNLGDRNRSGEAFAIAGIGTDIDL